MQLGSSLLWLWCRRTAAAPIPPLAREAPHAADVAVKRKQINIQEEERQVAVSPQLFNLRTISSSSLAPSLPRPFCGPRAPSRN